MNNVWDSLAALKIEVDILKCRSDTDKKYSRDLIEGITGNAPIDFYNAIDAVERGCGFQSSVELSELCQKAANQDSERLLNVIEEKTKMLEIVFLLYSTERYVKLDWVKNGLFHKPIVLYECLRQLLRDYQCQETEENDTIAKGLCRLSTQIPERFINLLNRYILFHEQFIPLFSRVMELLPSRGWAVFGSSLSFGDVDKKRMAFIDKCAGPLDWEEMNMQAYPLVEAWLTFLKKCVKNMKFGSSLYNDASNLLITILVYHTKTYKGFVRILNETVSSCESLMYQWYESVTQLRSVYFAHLTFMEHMHFVWENNCGKYAAAFPDDIRTRMLFLLDEWQFLWDDDLFRDKSQSEIQQLRNWLNGLTTG